MPDILRGKQWREDADAVVIPDWSAPWAQPPEAPEQEQPDGEPAPAPNPPEPAPPPALTDDQLRALYRPQWEALQAQLERRAYRDAVEANRARLERCLTEMNQHLNQLDESHERFLKEYAAALKTLAVDIAEKWVLRRLESDDSILEKLVMQAVEDVKSAKWMDVRLSEKMVGLARTIEKELQAPEYAGRAQVTPVDAPVGTCVVRTDTGDLDASVQTQARQLKKVFQAGG